MPSSAASAVGAAAADVGALYAKRERVYPRSVWGRFTAWRWVFVWLTQLFYYGVPWLQWNGRQAVLFDLDRQRFFLGGLVLYPQDLIFLAALLVLSAMALFFFTAVAGRLWCGYSCPQTVYTELFLWLERRFEGDRSARMRLAKTPWGFEKLWRTGGKQAAWLTLALWTGFTFVGYFTPIRTLAAELLQFRVGGWDLFWVLFYGGATYLNAGYLREQICTYMCPYARFQSALIDADSLVITYDVQRGEPRGALARKGEAEVAGRGDCIDCTLCVQVCPTGIDIRNGLQNACIACAACIDVCDQVMDKVGQPRGLIRYATENAVQKGWGRAEILRRALRPRVLIYGAILLAASGAFVASLALRSPLMVDVIRDRSSLGHWGPQGVAENVYRVQVMNRTEDPQRYRVQASGQPGLKADAAELSVGPAEQGLMIVRVQLPAESAQQQTGKVLPIVLEVAQLGEGEGDRAVAAVQREATTFLVPR